MGRQMTVMGKIDWFCIENDLNYKVNHEEKFGNNVVEREITFTTEKGDVIQYFSLLSMKVYTYQLKYNGKVYKRSNIDSTLDKLKEILKEIENS